MCVGLCVVATFSQVSSPSLGVYEIQMGRLTLRVSTGDITKETSDVIVNSSNSDFNLKIGERHVRTEEQSSRLSLHAQTLSLSLFVTCYCCCCYVFGEKLTETLKHLLVSQRGNR